MAEYKLKMTQDEKTTVQNALINMRYSSAVDEILADEYNDWKYHNSLHDRN